MIFNRAERRIAYTKNGLDLGVAFVDVKEELLYPTVGMRTPDEEVLMFSRCFGVSEQWGLVWQAGLLIGGVLQVVANFGALPFKTLPDHYLVEAAQRIQDRIGSTRIPKVGIMVLQCFIKPVF